MELLPCDSVPTKILMSACAQKTSGFGLLNNVKVKNESACAQQKH